MFWPCETRTSTCRSFATISSGLYRFLAIAVLLDVKDIPQVGPLQWGWIMSVVELGRLSCRLAIQETVRTAGVEAQHPVPDDLKSDTADLGRLGARCPIVDSREC